MEPRITFTISISYSAVGKLWEAYKANGGCADNTLADMFEEFIQSKIYGLGLNESVTVIREAGQP